MSDSHEYKITRRNFLLMMASTMLLSCTDSEIDSLDFDPGDDNAAKHVMLGLIYDQKAAEQLGREYLAAHPQYRSQETLVKAIKKALYAFSPDARRASKEEHMATALQQLIKDEYKKNQVESISSWLLSVTEARLYALAAF